MVKTKKIGAALAAATVMLSFAFVSAASALTSTCVGTPAAASITWSASSIGGVEPIAFLWGNGSTSTTQVVAVIPGTYSMTLQATDASSTVATTTCAATIAVPLPAAPVINTFGATPSTITTGQSAVLSWTTTNASSTSVNNGIGAVSSTSITVSPTVTTTYTLSAFNPGGTTTAAATITVNAVTPPAPTGTTTVSQIQNLLNQIAALKAQILQLLLQNQGGGSGTGTGTTTATSTLSCFSFGRDLRRGHGGDDVKQMQLLLASDPTILPPEFATGFFGKKTEEALKKYQRKFGIGSSGFFGPLSRKYFKEQCTDTDHDGVLNLTDSDDDNDGITDTSDPHPLIPESKFSATSTREREGEHEGKGR